MCVRVGGEPGENHGSHTVRSCREPQTPGGTKSLYGLAVNRVKTTGPTLRGAAKSCTLQEGPRALHGIVVYTFCVYWLLAGLLKSNGTELHEDGAHFAPAPQRSTLLLVEHTTPAASCVTHARCRLHCAYASSVRSASAYAACAGTLGLMSATNSHHGA